MNKNQLRELGQKVGLDYVCTEKKFFIFCRQLKPAYIFEEYRFLLEDLTEKNMLLMLKLKVTR